MRITQVIVRDVRFPTSQGAHGSDAMHTDPDYSAAYVSIVTDGKDEGKNVGYGHTFTLGRGTEVVVAAINSIASAKLLGAEVDIIFSNMGKFQYSIANESQMRWLGPEKGVTHLALAAIMNALWDLRARLAGKPLWKFAADLSPQELLNSIDFSYLDDELTKEEALKLLEEVSAGKAEREEQIIKQGYPAYVTSAGWLGYSDEQIEELCRNELARGFRRFKAKVGVNIQDDRRRLARIRETIGNDCLLMVDANQRWSVPQAIEWMLQLQDFGILWIEEPTYPDDVIGHQKIARALAPTGIRVATGEHCQNRILFKQFLANGAMQFCQADACRLAGFGEAICVCLLARKFNIPVCPHAGGVGLCEINQHIAIFDFVAVSASLESRMCEFADHLHEHYVTPVEAKDGCYRVPLEPGNGCQFNLSAIDEFEYPHGTFWKNFCAGTAHN